MVYVMLNYVTEDGDEKQFRVRTNAQSVNLAKNKIKEIDLTPLKECKDMRRLILRGNPLVCLDLSSLSKCTELEHLDISDCCIRTLDVTSLLVCSKLREFLGLPLYLYVIINSYGLQRPPALTGLFIGKKSLEFILRKMGLEYVRSQIDGLLRHPKGVVRHEVKCRLLKVLGLIEFFALDRNIADVLATIPDTKDIEVVSRTLKEKLMDLLREQLMEGGPSHFLGINDIPNDALIAGLSAFILEQRKKEILEITLYQQFGEVDLTPIWLTAFGFSLLQSLGVGLRVSIDVFEEIRSIIKRAGFRVKITTNPDKQTAPKMSEGLKEFLLGYGRIWSSWRLIPDSLQISHKS